MSDLSSIARPGGGFAMLAVDQREALRTMFGQARPGVAVPDDVLTEFKVAAARELSPHASAVLVDKQFAFDRIVADGAMAPGCGLIAAADEFVASQDEFVAESRIDRSVLPDQVRKDGAVALKLMVLWRPDESPAARIAMVEEFVALCRDADLLSIVEPVGRASRSGGEFDREGGILAAARELGCLGADLYKAEVPYAGRGPADRISDACSHLSEAIGSPWVVLSSGVVDDDFPRAVELACRAGASGFLAGRAVWRRAVDADDPIAALRAVAVPRLQKLAEVVDATVGR